MKNDTDEITGAGNTGQESAATGRELSLAPLSGAEAALHQPAVEPWPEPVNGALLDSLRALSQRFIVLPQWTPEMLALWGDGAPSLTNLLGSHIHSNGSPLERKKG